MRRSLFVMMIAACAVAGPRLDAHHRFAEIYLENREVTIEGEILRWEYRDPHSFVHVLVQNGRNQPEKWIVEWWGAGQLRKQGLGLHAIKPGQRVVITGSPGRIAADHRLRLRVMVRPQDGWKWRDVLE